MNTRRKFFANSIKGTLSIGLGASGFSIDSKAAVTNNIAAKKIPAIIGEVDNAQLGFTLMHEHLWKNYVEIPAGKEQESIDFVVAMLRDAARVGIRTIVDLSPARNIKMYEAIAKQVQVNIIVSTGVYLQQRSPEWVVKMSEGEFKDYMRKEILEGIQGTKIRPGIIKVAAMSPLTEWEKERFRAAAQTQKEFNIPIGTHATHRPGNQFDWLVKNGANPAKLFFSHIEAKPGWEGQSREQIANELLRIAQAGGSLLFNNFGYEFDTPWEDLTYLMRFLCDKGFENKVMTSMDTYVYWNNGKIALNVEDKYPDTRNKTYAYAVTDAVPALLKAGLSAKNIQTFFVENLAKFFS